MNTGPDLPDSALTPEERALAERIARAMPQREPSSALDARILEAARAAVEPAPAAAMPAMHPPTRVRRRWPAVVGIAATLVLAVGIGWQLRPHDEQQAAYSEIPKAAVVATASRGGGPQADVDTYTAMPRDAAERAQGEAEPDAAAMAKPATPLPQVVLPPPAPVPPLPPPPPPEEPPVIIDAPAAMDTPAPAPAEATYPTITLEQAPAASPPLQAPAPPQAQGRNADDTSEAGLSTGDTATSAARAAPERTREALHFKSAAPVESESNAQGNIDSGTLDKIEVTGGSRLDEDDQPLDAEPPASADSPQVQQAWLKRVRALLGEGRRDDARDSLREYQRRYPGATLPDDLRALLEE